VDGNSRSNAEIRSVKLKKIRIISEEKDAGKRRFEDETCMKLSNP
jgi:hypothetical protein